ncbi:LysR family transcriptional regulator [Phyllobacterium sp. TAF24]|uniref:LysR family transcriptional regulator n=1 Tax=Phyllobacterium sp. TAF24 TaxID=3233068 RepID=UPI003F95E36A
MDLDTSQLRAFVTVAELRSFSRASLQLNRVQSAVSQLIQRFEANISAKLFVRERGRISLTAEGEALLPYAIKMLAINDEAAGMLRRSQPTDCLRIGTSDTYAACFLPPILAVCREANSNLQIELHCGYSEKIWGDFACGDLDVVLTQSCPADIISETLHIEPLQWVCSKASDVHMANPVPLALFTRGCADRDLAVKTLAKAKKDYAICYQSTSQAGILAAVSSGTVVSAMAASTQTSSFKSLDESDGYPALGNLEISLAYHDHRDDSATSLFANVARYYFKTLPKRTHA